MINTGNLLERKSLRPDSIPTESEAGKRASRGVQQDFLIILLHSEVWELLDSVMWQEKSIPKLQWFNRTKLYVS